MKSTTRFSKNKRGIECLNCKQPISDNDNFCSECGQVNDLHRISIKQFVSEFFSGFFSFDTRFIKTFVPLLFKPGKVSKEYTEGKRKKYVNPFQLYLNVTIIFFLLQGLFSEIDEYNVSNFISNDTNTSKSDLNKTSNKDKNDPLYTYKRKVTFKMDSVFNNTTFLNYFKIDSISKQKKDSIYRNFQETNKAFITDMIAKDAEDDWGKFNHIPTLEGYVTNYTDNIFKINDIYYTTPPPNMGISFNKKDLKDFFGEKTGEKLNAFYNYNQEHIDAKPNRALTDLKYKKTRWNAFLFNISQNANKAKNDKSFLKSWGQSFFSKISIALFFLLPIFTLFLSLIYIRRKWNYTEHLVFVFNTQTVFFLLLIAFEILDRIIDLGIFYVLFFPLFLFHLFKAMRKFYEQHWLKTHIKFFLLNCLYIILSVVGLLIVSFIAFVF